MAATVPPPSTTARDGAKAAIRMYDLIGPKGIRIRANREANANRWVMQYSRSMDNGKGSFRNGVNQATYKTFLENTGNPPVSANIRAAAHAVQLSPPCSHPRGVNR